ncbi:hypothetical protein ACXVUM_10775 [Williamsia sp. SKLECPSW1]
MVVDVLDQGTMPDEAQLAQLRELGLVGHGALVEHVDGHPQARLRHRGDVTVELFPGQRVARRHVVGEVTDELRGQRVDVGEGPRCRPARDGDGEP